MRRRFEARAATSGKPEIWEIPETGLPVLVRIAKDWEEARRFLDEMRRELESKGEWLEGGY